MKKSIALICLVGAVAAAPVALADECPTNLGQLTSSQIADGFEQGPHSSSFAGEPRVGLANVVERGNLAATVAFLILAIGICS